jgi:hypothetical protein
MSKKSGFAVRITAFIEADANDGESMKNALSVIEAMGQGFRSYAFIDIKVASRFMLSREVPDAAPAAEDGLLGAGGGVEMPPIPATMRRT